MAVTEVRDNENTQVLANQQDVDITHEKKLSDIESQSVLSVGEQVALESGNQIQYRTCSWQKTTAILMSEYICLAITSFPWSYSVLGLVPGILVTIGVAATVQYTSLILWKFCLKHPEARDVCDIGKILFGGSQLAYNLTGAMFILNNTFIQALHCLVGAKLLNTLSNGGACTVVFSFIAAIVCFLLSLPRTFDQLSLIGTFSAATMFIAVVLLVVFSGIQGKPAGYTEALGDPIWTLWPVKGTTYVDAMSAFLNISYTFIGQICLPSFIHEMKKPEDFPKALTAVTICELIVFTICGGYVYTQAGNQYVTAPAFGSLTGNYKKIAFSFALPTIIFLGSLYSVVTGKFVFFRIFGAKSKHRTSNTVLGWGVWAAILAVTWVLAFILSEVIPFFSDLLSLMSSLFDGWFGFIFWGMAYLIIYPAHKRWATPWKSVETIINYLLILLGFYVLIAGTYTSVESIIISYGKQRAQGINGVFTCASNAL